MPSNVDIEQRSISKGDVEGAKKTTLQFTVVFQLHMKRRCRLKIVEIVLAEDQQNERGIEVQQALQEYALINDRAAQDTGVQHFSSSRQPGPEICRKGLLIVHELTEGERIPDH